MISREKLIVLQEIIFGSTSKNGPQASNKKLCKLAKSKRENERENKYLH